MSGKHTHLGDGTVPGLHGEPVPTPVLGCPACATVHSIGGELGAAPTSPAPSLADFLLARIAEDEAAVNDRTRHLTPGGWSYLEQFGDFGDDERWMIEITAARLVAECEAKRAIVEWHQSWPVLVETTPQFESVPGDINAMTYRMTQQIAWTTQEEYRKRFGSEPPTAPVLRLLALPYADHPDYRQEWRP